MTAAEHAAFRNGPRAESRLGSLALGSAVGARTR
jgi:hypothetical protein